MTDRSSIRVLWVEDDSDDYVLARAALTSTEGITFDLTWVTTFEDAQQALTSGVYDICLIDYSLGSHNGLELIRESVACGIQVPMILLTGLEDETIALQAVSQGAQDYLVKGRATRTVLMRAIRYAIERYKMQSDLLMLSMHDDQTGLYNRRGFFTLVNQQLRLVGQQRPPLLMLYANLNRVRWINDTFGYEQGSHAIITFGQALQGALRKTDIVARLGGDEFEALVMNANAGTSALIEQRLNDILRRRNTEADCRYELSFSMGAALFATASTFSLEEMIDSADRAMCENKRNKRAVGAEIERG